MTMRHLTLTRAEPGPSEETKPTGIVAEAVVFGDGTAILHWLTEPGATEVYASEQDMRKIREASGRSRFYEDASAVPRDHNQELATLALELAGLHKPHRHHDGRDYCHLHDGLTLHPCHEYEIARSMLAILGITLVLDEAAAVSSLADAAVAVAVAVAMARTREQSGTCHHGWPEPAHGTPAAESRRLCPDGGTCHHGCTQGCLRVRIAGPLSAAEWGDTWPEHIREANSGTGGQL